MSLVKERQELEDEFASLFEEVPVPLAYGASAFSHPSWPVLPAEDPKRAHMIRWGLIPHWADSREKAKKLRNMTANARLETAWKLPSFRASIGPRRCLVVADGFYEPHRYGNASYPFFIYRRDRRPFALGGLYDRWRDPVEGIRYATFSVITVPAAGVVEKVHNEKLRMPALIPPEAYQVWLDPAAGRKQIEDAARSFAVEDLCAHPVGPMLYQKGRKEGGAWLQELYQYGIPAVDYLLS